MTYSEKVLVQICKIADKMKMSLFEATAWYCEALMLEPSELYNSLDEFTKQRIKNSAGEGRYVQKKVFSGNKNALL